MPWTTSFASVTMSLALRDMNSDAFVEPFFSGLSALLSPLMLYQISASLMASNFVSPRSRLSNRAISKSGKIVYQPSELPVTHQGEDGKENLGARRTSHGYHCEG